jgi:hypothetical protein
MAQVVEHLPRKCEALSSNSGTAKGKMNVELSEAVGVGRKKGET